MPDLPLYFYILGGISLFALSMALAAVAANFLLAAPRSSVKRQRRSPVATLTMLLFFLVMGFLLARSVKHMNFTGWFPPTAAAAGCAVVAFACAVNIWSRFYLRGNWGDQIRIYERHTLVTAGPYAAVRHPLYSTTILMLLGLSLLFWNLPVLLLTLAVYVPMMALRAKQEERLLVEHFGEEYEAYRNRTGMLFPRLKKGGKLG